MNKIVIFGIIYRNHPTVAGFIESIASSVRHAEKSHGKLLNLTVNLLDNSELTIQEAQAYLTEFESKGDKVTNIVYHSMKDNLGYLGPLGFAQNILKGISAPPNTIIYSNTDILFDIKFVNNLLLNYTISLPNIAMVAPSIIIGSTGFDQNPKYLTQPKLSHLNFLKRVYSSYQLAVCYEKASLLKILISYLCRTIKKILGKKNFHGKLISSIYAAHGACFVFIDSGFFMSVPRYPVFLFGEELYLAALAKKSNFETVFDPSLLIVDIRHSSIATLPDSKRVKFIYDSLVYLCTLL